MKIRRCLFVVLAILITSVLMTYISSYLNQKRAEDQLRNEKPIFAYNSERFPKGAVLTVSQAAQHINTAETAQMFNFKCAEASSHITLVLFIIFSC
jgi:hypothetical protein